MLRWTLQGAAVLAVLVTLACHERRDDKVPSAPALGRAKPGCDFNGMNSLVAHYFSAQEAADVRDLIDAMQAATDDFARRSFGFDVMVHIANNVEAGNANFNDASALTNELLKCMFTDPNELPATFPEVFNVATDPSQAGAYAVRGGAADPATDPVFSRDCFSGMAPPSNSTWPQMLDDSPTDNPDPNRILVYGRPGNDGDTYDWKVVPRSVTFHPAVVVAVDVDADANPQDMLYQDNVRALPFVTAEFFADCQTLVSAEKVPSPFKLAGIVARWGAALLSPTRLWAGSALSPGGIGGSTPAIKSEFGPQDVQAVTLEFSGPDAVVWLNKQFSVTVRATRTSDGTQVGGVEITLEAVDNNGNPVELVCVDACDIDVTATTDNSGEVVFTLVLNKTGAYRLVATGQVTGRSAIDVAEATSAKFNVKP